MTQAEPTHSSSDGIANHRCYLEKLLGIPSTEGNDLTFLRNGCEIFPAMLQDIEEAKHSIEFLTFVYWKGDIATEFATTLGKKAKQGLVVRVLLDSFGASSMDDGLVETMIEEGVDVRWFRPFSSMKIWRYDNRTHRKVLVCDNRVAYTGGVGIAKEWEGNARNPDEWRETHVRVEGPAVDGLIGSFWDNWIEAAPGDFPKFDTNGDDQPQKGEDQILVLRSISRDTGSDVANMMRGIIGQARKTLWIATPYFVIDEPMVDLLCEKAKEGVEVKILLPGPHLDRRFEWYAAAKTFESLLEGGVEIHRYDQTMMHQKLMLVDGETSIIGSANFNQRSQRRDAEIVIAVFSKSRHEELKGHFEEDLKHAHQENEGSWAHRPWWKRITERFVRAFKSQL
ncbi:phospholipase D-like domain-containing protein [Puniceicoccus vermicola]|uniref:Cardiolipin synthase B n=1 Tax=Puniceicoccus vermicola TaxID=388746 RepID=A0A7X1E5P8_9BACT|nr:phospholipase D-like domain-containing protein [Puniceicoccus vermicola]MBC2603875.1 cardiolipin synthase B [Puniceicoccus vermicola]